MGVFGNQKQVKPQFLLDKRVDFLPVRSQIIGKKECKIIIHMKEKESKKNYDQRYQRYNLRFKTHEKEVLLKKYQAYLDNGGEKAITPFLQHLCLHAELYPLELEEKPDRKFRLALYELNRIGVNLNQLQMQLNRLNVEGQIFDNTNTAVEELIPLLGLIRDLIVKFKT